MKGTRLLALLAMVAAVASSQKADLVVVEKVAGYVGFYTEEGKRVAGVKVGTHPHEMVLSPDRRTVYVTDNGILWMTNPGPGGNTVSIIDVASMKKTGVIDLGEFRRPHGIDLDPKSGKLYVTTENPSRLLLVDPTRRRVERDYDVKGKAPHMVFLRRGLEWAYVSNTDTGTLGGIHLKTGEAKLVPTGPRPQGGVFSLDGKLFYVTNLGGDSITVVDVAKMERAGEIRTGKAPVRIAMTPDGKTLVYALQAGEAVGFADVASRKEVAQIPLSGRPVSLTMFDNGRIAYSSVQEQDKIFVISVPDRKIIRLIQTPKDSGPDPVFRLR